MTDTPRACRCPTAHARHVDTDCGLFACDDCAAQLCDNCCAWQHQCVVCGMRFHDENHPHLNGRCPEAP